MEAKAEDAEDVEEVISDGNEEEEEDEDDDDGQLAEEDDDEDDGDPRDFARLVKDIFRNPSELCVTPLGFKSDNDFKRLAHNAILAEFLEAESFSFTTVCITNCDIDNAFLREHFIPHCMPLLPKVTSLDLTFNKIGEGAAEALLGSLHLLPHLKGLYLDGNLIQSGGISFLRTTQLERLGLRSCMLRDEGITHLTANIFQQESPVVFLNLKDNEITESGIHSLVDRAIAWMPPSASTAQRPYDGAVITRNHHCRHMSYLNLSNNKLGDDGITYLAVHGLDGLPMLEDLLLSACDFGDAGMMHLARRLRNHEKLDWLDVCDNRIGNRSCQELSVRIPPKLTKIAIKGNDLIGDEGRERLAVAMFYTHRCERIWGISLCLFWDVLNLPATYESAKNHEVLEFSRMQERPRPGPILHEPERKGRHWELERRVVADLDAKVREALNSLGTGRLVFRMNNSDLLALRQIPPEPLLQRLNRNTTGILNRIELRNCGIDSYWIHSFISNEGFHQCGNLSYLGLSRNGIGNDGAAALVRELAIRCPRLRVLSLLGNDISNDGVVAMCEPDAGQQLTHLTKIDLSFNSIGDVGAMKIAKELMPCLMKLETLDLGFNEITSNGAMEFALFGFHHGAPLKHLYFNDNRIRKRGQVALAKAIKQNLLSTIKKVWGVELSMHWEELGLPESLKGARNFTILTFLRSKVSRESVDMAFPGVIVTGPAEVGKSCLIHWLVHKNFPESPPEMTDCVDITELSWEDTKKLRFVDFGGQVVYEHTQLLFMVKYAIYVVVYAPRTSLSDRDPLTKTKEIANGILTLWPSAKIIFVASKADKGIVVGHRDDVKDQLRDSFGQNFAGWHSVSAKFGEGMFDLLHNIVAVAKEIQGTVEPVIMPVASLAQAINDISNKPEHPLHITWSDFKAMAVARGFRENEDDLLKDTLDMYAERGLVLILPGAISLEKTFIIVKQQELANVLSAVISPKADVAQNIERGLLRHDEVAKIWEEYDPALHSGFLRLIHDIELGFHILLKDEAGTTVDANASLIPAMLQVERTDEVFRDKMTVEHPIMFDNPFELTLEFEPESLVRTIGARLLVRIRDMVVLNRWYRNGAELLYTDIGEQQPKAYGRVEWDFVSDKPSLTLRSWGHELLPYLVFQALDAVRVVHNRNMRAERYRYVCEDSGTRREYNNDELAMLDSLKITHVACNKCNRHIDVKYVKNLVDKFFERLDAPAQMQDEALGHDDDEEKNEQDQKVEEGDEAEADQQEERLPFRLELSPELSDLAEFLREEGADMDTCRYRVMGSLDAIHLATCEGLERRRVRRLPGSCSKTSAKITATCGTSARCIRARQETSA